ncbi:MAG: TolC family protein [Muribaculaceae bacterium]|nr:TolC family protein [Muribaculaceae bacterium]
MTSLIIPIMAVAALTHPQHTDTLRWDLSQCLDYAHEHNVQLKQSRLSADAARYTLEASRARWQPTLDFATTHTLQNTPFAEQGDKNAYNSSYGLNASWTVYDGGNRTASIRRDRASLRAAEQNAEAERQTIDMEILKLYINLLYAREAIAVNTELAAVSAAQEERARALLESGRMARPDYAQLLAQAESDRYEVASARASYASRCVQLKQWLELDLFDTVEVQDVTITDEMISTPLMPIAEAYAMALEADANLRARKLRTDVAAESVKTARSSGLPSVALQAGVGSGYYTMQSGAWGSQMKRGLSEQLGLTVAVPIFNQKQTRTAVAQARIEELNAEYDFHTREDEIGQSLEEWYVSSNSSTSRYEAAAAKESAAALSGEMLDAKFSVGYVEVTDMIQAHATLSSARHERLQAKYMAVLARKMIEYLTTANVAL